MPIDAPLKLGPFIVDADGRLTPSTPDKFPSFRVCWRGHTFQARLATAEPQGGTLALQAVLGRVPSTGRAEQPATLPRQAAFAAVRALPGTMLPGWKVGLLPDHRILAEAHKHLLLPISAENLVTELTLFLLRLAPYLDLLEEGVGIEVIGDGAGPASAPRANGEEALAAVGDD
jgi:hypothetical protein